MTTLYSNAKNWLVQADLLANSGLTDLTGGKDAGAGYGKAIIGDFSIMMPAAYSVVRNRNVMHHETISKDDGKGWKNILNNLRLIIQPFILFNLIYPWLTVFPIPQLSLGFSQLQSIVYRLTSPIFIFLAHPEFYFSSA